MALSASQNIFVTQDPWGQRKRPWEDPRTTGPYIPPPSGGFGQGYNPARDEWAEANRRRAPVLSQRGTDGAVSTTQGTPQSAQDAYFERILASMPTQRQQGLSDLGSVLGSYSSGEKANRVVQGNFQSDYDKLMADIEARKNQLGFESQSDYDKLMMQAAANRREAETDAMQKLQQSSYIAGGGSNFGPQTISLGGKQVTLPTFAGIAPRASTPEEIAGASALRGQMINRINEKPFEPTKFTPAWNYQPADPSKYAKPGFMEQVGNYGALGASGLGALDMLTGGKSGQAIKGLLSRVPGLGGLAGKGAAGATTINAAGMPVNMTASATRGITPGIGSTLGKFVGPAGAALGTWDMLKNNHGFLGNVASGAGTGAAYGSFLPGIGTAVGAGIGALAGGIKSLFHRKKKPAVAPQPHY